MADVPVVAQGDKVVFVIDSNDNVAVALADLSAGEKCIVRLGDTESELEVVEDIAFGHKTALTSIAAGEPIYKYGEEIGRASQMIAQGAWVHTHNLYCQRGQK